jgi:hypothetical protein
MQALLDARNAFEQGGSNAWQSTVTSIRLALEKWRGIQQEDQGAGWTRPSRSDLESRTKKQRLDALRWHLMQIAHLGPHSGADEWSRDDALLMLTTLSVLLAERNHNIYFLIDRLLVPEAISCHYRCVKGHEVTACYWKHLLVKRQIVVQVQTNTSAIH